MVQKFTVALWNVFNVCLQKQFKPREHLRDGYIFRFFYVFRFIVRNIKKDLTRLIWQKFLFSTAWSKFQDFVNEKIKFRGAVAEH